jgi:GntR family transcriptional regulator, histidine utilization repressor
VESQRAPKKPAAVAAGLPLHQRIREDIEGRIMAGALRPGDRIPFEHQLMLRYGCSRMTVSKALSGLAAAGLIKRQRRAGSFVAQPKIHMAALTIPDIREEVMSRGFEYSLRLVTRRVLSSAKVAQDRMRMPAATKVLSLRCIHLADQQPFALEDRLINLAAVPEALQTDFKQVPPGTWLLQHVPWTEAEHRIGAINAGSFASALAVEPGAACLFLERKTWRGQESITYVRSIFAGGNFDLTAHFLAPPPHPG